VGVDVGANMLASVSRFRFFTNIAWTEAIRMLIDGKFQGSNDRTDATSWVDLAVIAQTVQIGWNTFASTSTTPYRYFRFAHTSQSKCNLAEIQFFGILYQDITVSLTEQASSVVYNDGFNVETFTPAIRYKQAKTPIVTGVSPIYGEVFGGYDLTING